MSAPAAPPGAVRLPERSPIDGRPIGGGTAHKLREAAHLLRDQAAAAGPGPVADALLRRAELREQQAAALDDA
ncbi:MAG: hypothetical protein F4X35_03075 [Alphaproteobacteria bacterium]|nr:hypothetical protein [Alphaproteobacteria bacterium]